MGTKRSTLDLKTQQALILFLHERKKEIEGRKATQQQVADWANSILLPSTPITRNHIVRMNELDGLGIQWRKPKPASGVSRAEFDALMGGLEQHVNGLARLSHHVGNLAMIILDCDDIDTSKADAMLRVIATRVRP